LTDQFEDFKKEAPTLVFDAAPKEPEKKPVPEKKEILNDSMLSQEERQQVDAFAEQIDLRNSGAVLHYGVGTQKKLADFSERALNNVRTKDMGEVGNMIAGLVTELRSFDAEEESRGFFGFLKKGESKLSMMKVKYNKVETNVNEIVKVLENHQIQLMKDIDVLDRMYEMNLTYFKELTMYILAGKKKLHEVRSVELPALQQKAQKSGLPEDAQEARDLADLCERFEKKLYDLELTRTVAIQTAPQIRMVQNADTLMAEKIQSTVVNTIPLWKSQMVIAIGVEHSAQAARAQREVTDMTNELLKKNADALKLATIESAKESERGIVDLETLKHTNETLITTLDEVMKIQSEGREKRRAAEAELTDMENQLKKKMLEISRI
jgi:Uncharacterized protein involved in tellurite resistance